MPMAKPPSFLDLHAPKHKGLEEWDSLIKGMKEPVPFTSHFSTMAPRQEGPKTLLDFYLNGDIRQILEDSLERPDHYSDRQRQILLHLSASIPPNPPVTDLEKDELVYQWQRQTELEQKSKEVVEKITNARHDQEDNKIVMENGQTLTEWTESSFERQDHGDKIII